MGKKSVKEDKNVYQQAREEINMTRAAASDAADGVLSESRIEKIENGSLNARPEDVVLMADIYNIISPSSEITTALMNARSAGNMFLRSPLSIIFPRSL